MAAAGLLAAILLMVAAYGDPRPTAHDHLATVSHFGRWTGAVMAGALATVKKSDGRTGRGLL
jgi:hypothetical protein